MYVIIVGGGKVGANLSKILEEEGHEVLLLEKDGPKAAKLQTVLGEIVQRGDGCEIRTMEEVGVGRADVVAAVTGHDEDNLVICQMAKIRFAVPRVIARINNPKNERIFRELGIQELVNSTQVVYNLINQVIDTDDVVPLAVLERGNLEIVHIDIGYDSKVAEKTISQIPMPEGCIIIAVLQKDIPSIPTPGMVVNVGDAVIALAHRDRVRDLRGVFSEF